MAGERIHPLNRGHSLVIHGLPRKAHVVDDDRKLRMTSGDLADLGQPLRRMHHHRNAVPLRLRPEPVGGAVGEPRPIRVAVKREPHAEHSGLLVPALEQIASLAGIDREAPHHREATGILLRRLQRIVVAVAFDRRRHQDGAIDAGAIHVGQELLIAVGRILPALAVAQERPVRPIGRPHMHLRVDDPHARCSVYASVTTRLRNTPMPVISISMTSPGLTLSGTSSVPSQTTSFGERVL
jgi:hypothetical protein